MRAEGLRTGLSRPVRTRNGTVYQGLPEYARRAREIKPEPGIAPDNPTLTPYEYQLFSQNGEDGVLLELLRRIGVARRTFVEFGIESDREGNCVALADILGWHGLFMEADGALHHDLHRKYHLPHRP